MRLLRTLVRETEIVSNVHSNTTDKESRVQGYLGLGFQFGARRLSPHTVSHGHSNHSIVSYPVCGINARDASMLVMPQSVTGNRDSVIVSMDLNRIFLFNHEL